MAEASKITKDGKADKRFKDKPEGLSCGCLFVLILLVGGLLVFLLKMIAESGQLNSNSTAFPFCWMMWIDSTIWVTGMPFWLSINLRWTWAHIFLRSTRAISFEIPGVDRNDESVGNGVYLYKNHCDWRGSTEAYPNPQDGVSALKHHTGHKSIHYGDREARSRKVSRQAGKQEYRYISSIS